MAMEELQVGGAEDDANDSEEACGADSCNTTPGKHHGHVLRSGRNGRADKEEQEGGLHGPMPPVNIGEGGIDREEGGGREKVDCTDVAEGVCERGQGASMDGGLPLEVESVECGL